MSVRLETLLIEVTRKCNLACPHCGRGDAQDRVISYELIDRILDNIYKCGRIHLTGGEPFLVPDVIDYLVDSIIERKLPVIQLTCITNGTIQSKQVANAFTRFGEYSRKELPIKYKQPARISISIDKYHTNTVQERKKTFLFYKDICGDSVKVSYHNPFKDSDHICYIGKAVDNYEILGKPEARKYYPLHRAKIDEYGLIEDDICVTVNGDVHLSEFLDYSETEQYKMGNLWDNTIGEIVTKNQKEPWNKAESMLYSKILGRIHGLIQDEIVSVEDAKELRMLMKEESIQREKLRQYLPGESVEDICKLSVLDYSYRTDGVYGDLMCLAGYERQPEVEEKATGIITCLFGQTDSISPLERFLVQMKMLRLLRDRGVNYVLYEWEQDKTSIT